MTTKVTITTVIRALTITEKSAERDTGQDCAGQEDGVCCGLLARIHASCQQDAEAGVGGGNAMCCSRRNTVHVHQGAKPRCPLPVLQRFLGHELPQRSCLLGPAIAVQPSLLPANLHYSRQLCANPHSCIPRCKDGQKGRGHATMRHSGNLCTKKQPKGCYHELDRDQC